MALPSWALPEYFEDVLPVQAQRLENLRRSLLDEFRLCGYQYVIPPSVEYLDSLVSGAGQELADSTFKFVDQISGRTLGLRADITPQVTRIDAHLLNRRGVTRLCYCASVVNAMPRSMTASREPIQIGAEVYGHAGIEADVEILRLLARTLELAALSASRIDVGHIGIFRALSKLANLSRRDEEALFGILQAKDVPGLQEFVARLDEPVRGALLALPELYGDASVLGRARAILPDVPGVREALDEMSHLAVSLAELPLSFDLSDVRGYLYHTGLMFSAYCGGSPTALALGGRYDAVGKVFGRARPATGFSLDLRELLQASGLETVQGAILAPLAGDDGLVDCITRLRAAGEIVLRELPGHEGSWREAGCDRRIVVTNGAWSVVPLEE